MTDANVVLSVENLCKAYGALKVSDHVSLAVHAGEVHALIGPNGAGKTSLVGQISGLVTPDSGRVVFEGRDVTALSMAQRAASGLVRSFQITQLLPRMTALENVALAVQARAGSSFRLFGHVACEEQLNAGAHRALAAFGLADRAGVPAASLSHGERRQLELAVALALEPKVLLLDEPMAGTGHEEAVELVARIAELKSRCAILLIEHDMDAVFQLADRISVLADGRIIASGTPQAIRANSAVRAAYLGEAEWGEPAGPRDAIMLAEGRP